MTDNISDVPLFPDDVPPTIVDQFHYVAVTWLSHQELVEPGQIPALANALADRLNGLVDGNFADLLHLDEPGVLPDPRFRIGVTQDSVTVTFRLYSGITADQLYALDRTIREQGREALKHIDRRWAGLGTVLEGLDRLRVQHG